MYKRYSALVGPVAVLVAVASSPPPARAEVTTAVEVLAIASDDAVDEAAAMTEALRGALTHTPGLADSGGRRSLEAVALTVGCAEPMEPTCPAKMAKKLGNERFIFGTLRRADGKLTVNLRYYNQGNVQAVTRVYLAGPIALDGQSPAMRRLASRLLLGLAGVAPPAAAEPDDEAPVPIVAPKPRRRTPADAVARPSSEPNLRLYGSIALIGLGVGFIGAGIATSLSVNDSQQDPDFIAYRSRFPTTVRNTCNRAKAGDEGYLTADAPLLAGKIADFCDDLHMRETLQYVFYGVGGAMVAGGAALLLTAPSSGGANRDRAQSAPPLRVSVAPLMGGGYLSVGASF